MDISDSTIDAAAFETAASAIASPEETESETLSADAEAPEVDLEASDEAPAEEASADNASVVVDEKPKGPIPFEVHHKSLENARIKGGEEALAKHRETYGWAETPEAQRFVQTAQRMNTEPRQFTQELVGEVLNHPQEGAEMRRWIVETARQLTEQDQADSPQPDVQIVDEHGRVVGMSYSAQLMQQQLARAEERAAQRALKEFQARLTPLERQHQAETERVRMESVNAKVDQQLAEAAAWPHFKEYEKQITAEVQKGASLEDAYNRVFVRDIYPKTAAATRATERAAVIGHIANKPAASTASPSGGSLNAPSSDADKTWADVFREKAPQYGLG